MISYPEVLAFTILQRSDNLGNSFCFNPL